jgi:hypothetical protein
MEVNMKKSSLHTWGLSDFECQHISKVMGTPITRNLRDEIFTFKFKT